MPGLISGMILDYHDPFRMITDGFISQTTHDVMLAIFVALPGAVFDAFWLKFPIWMSFISHLTKSIERRFYDESQMIVNGEAPESVYKLNIGYSDHIHEDCNICLEALNEVDHGRECIIKCGHRFHHSCLRQWELCQFHNNPYQPYSCPICKQQYDWREKWQFDANLWSKYQ